MPAAKDTIGATPTMTIVGGIRKDAGADTAGADTGAAILQFDSSGNLRVSQTSASSTIDTELPAAAALADAASATPTTPTIGAVNLVMNATTADRQRAVVNALDSAGTGIAAAGLVGQLDDTSPSTVTENQWSPVRITSLRLLKTASQGANNTATGQVAPTNSAATLLAARTTRRYVTFLNYGTVTVYIGPAAVTTANGFALDPGASKTFETTVLLQAITAAGTGAIHYDEAWD